MKSTQKFTFAVMPQKFSLPENSYLKAEYPYPTRPGLSRASFFILGTDHYCRWEDCAHLNGRNWRRVEAERPRLRHKCEWLWGCRISCWDCGEKIPDRWTVVYLDTLDERGNVGFRGMSDHPWSPQGIGMWGEMPIGFVCYEGRGGAFKKRVPFRNLPSDCQSLVEADCREMWETERKEKAE